MNGDTINQNGSFGVGYLTGNAKIEKNTFFNKYTQNQYILDTNTAEDLIRLLEISLVGRTIETPIEKLEATKQLAICVERDVDLKKRIINALKAGGTEAFKEIMDRPLVNIFLAAVEGWKNA